MYKGARERAREREYQSAHECAVPRTDAMHPEVRDDYNRIVVTCLQ